jgi:hypothetical protein
VRPGTLTALLASAVLGVVFGIGGGLYVARDADVNDPLGLGVAMVDQPCSDNPQRDPLLVVATGDSSSALAGAVAEAPDSTRYLDVSHSCDTAWVTDQAQPRYAAYVGPYANARQACEVRMTAAHRGDLVTLLRSGDTQPVECACYLSYTAMPVLRPGMEADAVEGIYIRALQRLLLALGEPEVSHSKGAYDARTIAQVRRVQDRILRLPATGIVDAQTWHALQTQACALYTS